MCYTYLFDTQQSISGLLDVFVHICGELQLESVARVSRGWQVGVPSPPGLSQLILLLIAATDKQHSQITRHSHFTRRNHSRNTLAHAIHDKMQHCGQQHVRIYRGQMLVRYGDFRSGVGGLWQWSVEQSTV